MTERQHGLPLPLTSFIGREHDTKVLSRLISTARLVTLTGVGGVGKTRLALHVATARSSSFADGVCFVEFAPLTDASLVTQEVAAALGLREQIDVPLLVTITQALRDTQLLLVLDNCEHLIGPCAELAERLLRSCPGLRILATSREVLRCSGEVVYTVRPLPTPNRQSSYETSDIMRYAAPELFQSRARAFDPHFSVNESNAATVAYICQQLDGIPLALELAAARMKMLSVELIAARLDDRFQLLTSGARTASRRQRTLRAAIEWSYEALPVEEQALFNRLSVFTGGCTLEALEAVCAGSIREPAAVLDLVSALVDKSLVQVDTQRGQQRFRVLESLRLYGRERLVASGEGERTGLRHAEHYLSLAERAEPELWGPDMTVWLEYLEREHDNLRTALQRSVGRGDTEIALRLCSALCRFWQVRGHVREGLRWVEGGLAWRAGASPACRARALDAAGHLARDMGDFERAATFYDESLHIRRALEDDLGVGLVLNNLGLVAQYRGDYHEATRFHLESLATFERLDNRYGVGLAHLTLGTIAQLHGDLDRAASHSDASLAVFRLAGDKRGIAAALNNLGNVSSAQSDFGAAEAYYEQSAALFQALGDRREVAACLSNLCGIARERGDEPRAISLCRESVLLFYELGDRRGLIGPLEALARVLKTREPDRAACLLGAAESLRQATGSANVRAPRDRHEVDVAFIRKLLGQRRLSTAWARGEKLAADATLDDLLTQVKSDPASVATTARRSSVLTPREREVAGLIVRGITNREIASTLRIAERTADSHVEHILTKLDLRTRAQIAAWVVQAEQSETIAGIQMDRDH